MRIEKLRKLKLENEYRDWERQRMMDGLKPKKADFAAELDMSASYLSQLTSDDGKTRMGAAKARELEKKLGKPDGWFDSFDDFLTDDAVELAQKWMLLPGNAKEEILDFLEMKVAKYS